MKRILVIDDDEYSAEVAAGFLTGAGYEVAIASNGFAGLKTILTQKPDLVITDIWMPIGTGLSLVQRLRELNLNKLPIIFMTAGRQEGLRDSAMGLGIFAYFEKPYDSKELLAAVAWALAPDRDDVHASRVAESLAGREIPKFPEPTDASHSVDPAR